MNDYWRRREEQAQLEYELTTEEYIEQLNGIYDYMIDQIKKEINGFYSKYSTAEGITMAGAKQRTSQLDIEEYERKAKKYVEEKNFSAQANEEMRLYNLTMKVNRLQMLEANIGLEMVSSFDELNTVLGEDLTERALTEMRRQAGILGKTVQDNAKRASSIVGASFHNATFSERIWMYQGMLRDELDSLLRQGLIQGYGPLELARHLNNLFDTGRYNCERLMRTELTRVQSDAQLESFTANGFNEYQFNALGDACADCRALDEMRFKVSDAEVGINLPPIHPNCRCAVSAWMDDAPYQEWLGSYANHGMSYEDWLMNREFTSGQSSSIIISGAVSGALNPYSDEAQRHAEQYYESVRHMKTDVARIAKNTGWEQDKIKSIKSYVFVEEHELWDGTSRFTPSYDMAQSWQRLIDGKNIKEQDLVLLDHEYLELSLVSDGMAQNDAHIEASRKYNYAKYLE